MEHDIQTAAVVELGQWIGSLDIQAVLKMKTSLKAYLAILPPPPTSIKKFQASFQHKVHLL